VSAAIAVLLLGAGLVARFARGDEKAIRHAMLRECREKYAAARTAADSDRSARWIPPTQAQGIGKSISITSCWAIVSDSLYYGR